jgi:hypothetical protein
MPGPAHGPAPKVADWPGLVTTASDRGMPIAPIAAEIQHDC